MTLIYWEWYFIPRSPLRSIFALFPEQLLKDFVSWGSSGVFHDRSLLGRCLRGFVLPVLEYCSALWCSGADTRLKLLDRVVSGTNFLTGSVFEYDIAYRRYVAVLCMLNMIGCNPMHPLYSALPVLYVLVRVTRDALAEHRHTYASSHCRTFQYRRTIIPLSVFLWIRGTILLTLYLMVWDRRVSGAGPMFFY